MQDTHPFLYLPSTSLFCTILRSRRPTVLGLHSTHDERNRTMGSRDYGRPQAKTYLKTDNRDRKYIDYKSVEDLRRLMTPNGKIYSRKRLGTSAKEQRMVAQAIKRARFMALLPFTSGTM